MYKQITTIAAAYLAVNIDQSIAETMFAGLPEEWKEFKKAELDYQVVVAAIRGKFKVDWADTKTWKRYPWWEITNGPSGPGLSYYDYVCSNAYADVGARQVFDDEEQLEHFVEHFRELAERYYFC